MAEKKIYNPRYWKIPIKQNFLFTNLPRREEVIMESNAEIRGKIEAYKDILNQSNSLPQQKLIEYCQEKLTSELKKLHSRTVSNSKG